jgi:glycosyltransferase involved in cell wall biosynthesis
VTARPSVLLITDALIVGGLERLVVDFAAGLADRGWRVGVLAGPGALWDDVPPSVTRHHLRHRDLLRTALQVRALLRKHDYDLVHAHQRGVALAALVAARPLGVPVVEHVHNVFSPNPVARLLSFRGDALVACGSAVAEMLVHAFHRPESRVHLVLNGVPDPGATSAKKVEDLRRLRVVGVGRMTDQKNPARFVRVVHALREILGPGVVAAEWVGDGPLMPAARAAIEVAGLQDDLLLPGEVQPASDRIAAADVLLLTSRWEGLPLVALESLAAGRGVVLPDVGSCRDAVRPDVGLLYDVDITDRDLAHLLASRFRSGAIAAWKREARAAWSERFTFDRVLDDLEAVFEPLFLLRSGDRVRAR